MVICDLHIEGITSLPHETDSPLLVDADTVLSGSISFQALQPVSRWNAQVVQCIGVVQHTELAPRNGLDAFWQRSGTLSLPDLCGFLSLKAFDHTSKYNAIRHTGQCGLVISSNSQCDTSPLCRLLSVRTGVSSRTRRGPYAPGSVRTGVSSRIVAFIRIS